MNMLHIKIQELAGREYQTKIVITELVIEDYNTDGVRGDLDFIDDEDGDSKTQDVFHLFRSLQKTGKGSDQENQELGSWGMGKNMYAQTSNLGGFFGYSIREHRKKSFYLECQYIRYIR